MSKLEEIFKGDYIFTVNALLDHAETYTNKYFIDRNIPPGLASELVKGINSNLKPTVDSEPVVSVENIILSDTVGSPRDDDDDDDDDPPRRRGGRGGGGHHHPHGHRRHREFGRVSESPERRPGHEGRRFGERGHHRHRGHGPEGIPLPHDPHHHHHHHHHHRRDCHRRRCGN
jgi:hypothetical protein